MKWGLAVIFLFVSVIARGQLDENAWLGLEAGIGAIFKHSQQIEHLSNANPHPIEIHYRKKYTGKRPWERKLGYPSLGIFISYTDMNFEPILGRAIHTGSYMAFPIIDRRKFDFEFRLGLGMTYATNKFDLETNRKNNLYSTDFSGTGYVHFRFMYELSKRIQLASGFGLIHFSNGSYKLPNLGGNILSINVGTFYKLNNKPYEREEVNSQVEGKPKYLLNIGTGFGFKETFPIQRKRYEIYTLMLQIERKSAGIHSWLGGIDIGKNTSLEDEQAYLEPDKEFINDYRVAALGGYSLNLDDFSALGQVGIYLYSPVTPIRPFYTKIGFRYRIFNEFHLGLNLKAHAGVADFVEYVITYKI
jgi:hypothetical protein